MIKKKTDIDLRKKDIRFFIQQQEYKALRFYQTKMTLDVMVLGNENQEMTNIPFAYLPKEIKKIIKPT